MKLRYFQTYDQNGLNNPIELQYWDEEEKIWISVNFIRVSYKDELKSLNDEFDY